LRLNVVSTTFERTLSTPGTRFSIFITNAESAVFIDHAGRFKPLQPPPICDGDSGTSSPSCSCVARLIAKSRRGIRPTHIDDATSPRLKQSHCDKSVTRVLQTMTFKNRNIEP
jgi:hypothetical protein